MPTGEAHAPVVTVAALYGTAGSVMASGVTKRLIATSREGLAGDEEPAAGSLYHVPVGVTDQATRVVRRITVPP